MNVPVYTAAQTPSRLPARVFYLCVALTIAVVAGFFCYSLVTGWVPQRSSSGIFTGIILPLWGGALLAIVTASYVISGDTMMHHYRTGTVQRASEPRWFWMIVKVQSGVAALLLLIGCANLIGL